METNFEALPVGNCLRLIPSQSPMVMKIHSAEGNCLRPTPGQSLPNDIYLKLPRYYPETITNKLLRYYPTRCGGQMHVDILNMMASQEVLNCAGPVQRSSR